MRHGVVVIGLVLGSVLAMAAPAAAIPPIKDTVTREASISDNGEACGFPVQWNVELTGRRTRYYDDSGRLVRAQIVIREDNTIVNLDTGKTLREGPDAFLQRVDYWADGSITVSTSGTSVNVRSEDGTVVDRGRFVVHFPVGQAPEILHNAGMHLPRELLLEGGEVAVLAAFCDVLE